MLAVAHAFGAATITLVGHSMGAFVAALAAARYPQRVRSLVLVDGGPAFPAPPDLEVDAALTAVIGPAMERLGMRFDDRAAYLDFWRAHPALGPLFAGTTAGALQAYLLHDLREDGDALVSTCVPEAIRADGGDVLADPEVHAAVRTAVGHGIPTQLLWARRGLMDEPQGLYDEQRLAALELPAALRVTPVPDTNHYTILLERGPAEAVAAAVAVASAAGQQVSEA